MQHIAYFRDTPNPDKMGEIGSAIARLHQANFLTPPGFILTPTAFKASLTQQQLDRFERLWRAENIDIEEVQGILASVTPSETIQLQILQVLADLFPYGGLFTVRPAPIFSETEAQSPHLDTFFAVPPEDLEAKITAVWRSLYSPQVLRFRQQYRNYPLPHPPAIVIQQMLNPSVSGMAYGADLGTGRRNIFIITAVYGLGKAEVGNSDADSYYLHHSGKMLQRHLAYKRSVYRVPPQQKAGIQVQPVPPEVAAKAALDDTQITTLASLIKRVGQTLASPQEIHWAIHNNQVYILQAQPISNQSPPPQHTGRETLWDNRYFAPHYPQQTTPLTVSSLRRSYPQMVQSLNQKLGLSLPPSKPYKLMGFLNGKLYHNLSEIYASLQQNPVFLRHRSWLQPVIFGEDFPPPDLSLPASKRHFTIPLLLTEFLLRLLWQGFKLPGQIKSFHKTLKTINPADYPSLSLGDLSDRYREIEAKLAQYSPLAPLNTLLASLGYHTLKVLCQRWCEDSEGTLPPLLLSHTSPRLSLLTQLRQFAAQLARYEAVVESCRQDPLETILEQIAEHPDLQSTYDKFLQQWGNLGVFPLPLETPSLQDDPLPLLRWVAHWTQVPSPPPPDPQNLDLLPVRRSLRAKPLRRWVLHRVVGWTQKRSRDRVTLYHAQTRISRKLRQLFLEFGQRFFVLDQLKTPEDIFYLEIEEILHQIEGTATCQDSKSLVSLRKNEHLSETPHETSRSGHRLLTHLLPSRPTPFEFTPDLPTTDIRQGITCAAGRVRSAVRYMANPHPFPETPTHKPILVTPHPHPSWVMYFPLMGGLLIEQGDPLCLLAIFARSYGLPMVTSLTGLKQWLQDGDWIELDGNTGRVSRFTHNLGDG
ncbi:PEP/pyruvate-binding domain-containing protein [Spirulina sp. CS-785/01]|uniref:PEP/pyruvate-binding domain-containing protein n=1 Tax=Spirulina sp. CS-785/01 TaxID=3021716 RepID=UPI00232DE919|nr:PEP/pyruvate-binding domain-containing protein [Spirulina sp. CS-785/01]MDB9312618.1 PEP/pyruvate-binding domain-containing protein [Spirulina sp. CS-785/01]